MLNFADSTLKAVRSATSQYILSLVITPTEKIFVQASCGSKKSSLCFNVSGWWDRPLSAYLLHGAESFL